MADGLDPDVEAALDARLQPAQAGDVQLLARVKARVLGALAAQDRPGFRTVRRGGAGWECAGPGVHRKRLWDSGSMTAWMVRLAPGATVPAHGHAADEECVVLEGSLRIGELVLHAGDFHAVRQGTLHEAARTESGALVYLRAASAPPAG